MAKTKVTLKAPLDKTRRAMPPFQQSD